jgi:uncharacterized protein
MVAAGLAVGALFSALGWVPSERTIAGFATGISWDATTYLDIVVLIVIALLLIRFLRTGGVAMLRMMNAPSHHMAQHESAEGQGAATGS